MVGALRNNFLESICIHHPNFKELSYENRLCILFENHHRSLSKFILNCFNVRKDKLFNSWKRYLYVVRCYPYLCVVCYVSPYLIMLYWSGDIISPLGWAIMWYMYICICILMYVIWHCHNNKIYQNQNLSFKDEPLNTNYTLNTL